MADKTKTALLILAKGKPKGSPPPEEKGGDESDEGEEAAAGDILAAVKAGDAGALNTALRNWHDIACGSDDGEG